MDSLNEELAFYLENEENKRNVQEIQIFQYILSNASYLIDDLTKLKTSDNYREFRIKFKYILSDKVEKVIEGIESQRRLNRRFHTFRHTPGDEKFYIFFVLHMIKCKSLRYVLDILDLSYKLSAHNRFSGVHEMIENDCKIIAPLFSGEIKSTLNEILYDYSIVNNISILHASWSEETKKLFCRSFGSFLPNEDFQRRLNASNLTSLYDKEALNLILSSNDMNDFLNQIPETLQKQELYECFDKYDSTVNFDTYFKILFKLRESKIKGIISIFTKLPLRRITDNYFLTLRAVFCELLNYRMSFKNIKKMFKKWPEEHKTDELLGEFLKESPNQQDVDKPFISKFHEGMKYTVAKHLATKKYSQIQIKEETMLLLHGIVFQMFNTLSDMDYNAVYVEQLVRLHQALSWLVKPMTESTAVPEKEKENEVKEKLRQLKFEDIESHLLRLLFFDIVAVNDNDNDQDIDNNLDADNLKIVNRMVGQLYTATKELKLPMIAVIAACKGKGFHNSKNLVTREKVDIILSTEEEANDFVDSYGWFFVQNDVTIASVHKVHMDDYKGPTVNKAHVIVGTLAGVVCVQQERYKPVNSGHKQVVLVSDLDEVIFRHKSLVLEILNPQLNALTPLLYRILFRIFYDSKAKIPQLVIDKEPQCEQVLIRQLKASFKHEETFCSVKERAQKFLAHNSQVSYDVDALKMIVEDIFHWDTALCLSKVPNNMSRANLRDTIREVIKGDTTQDYSIYFGEPKGVCRNIWLDFESKDDAMKVWRMRSSFQRNIVGAVKRASSTGNTVVAHGHVSRCRVTYDLNKAMEIAEMLDLTRGIDIYRFDTPEVTPEEMNSVIYAFKLSKEDKKVSCDVEKYIEQRKQLDNVLYYLRYVHLYCYYSNRQYKNIVEMMEHGFYPCVRENMFCVSLSRYVLWKIHDHYSLFLALKDFDIGLQKSINNMKLNVNDPVLEEDLCLKVDYSNLINDLPQFLKNHCIVQFDLWIENCYKALLQTDEDSEYFGNIIHFPNNSDSEVENVDLPDGFIQFVSMKNSNLLIPPMVSASTVSIPTFLKSYESFYGFTEACGKEERIDFIEDLLHVKTTKLIPNNMKRVGKVCYRYPDLVFKSLHSWQQAICLSVEQQLRLQKSVLVLAENFNIVSTQLKPLLNAMLQQFIGADLVVCEEDSKIRICWTQTFRVFIATTKSILRTQFSQTETCQLHKILTYVPDSKYEMYFCAERGTAAGNYQLIILNKEGRSVEDIEQRKYEEYLEKIRSLDPLPKLKSDIMEMDLSKTEKNEQDFLFWKNSMLKTPSKGILKLNVNFQDVLNGVPDAFDKCEHNILVAKEIMLHLKNKKVGQKIPESLVKIVEDNSLNPKYSGLALYFYGYYVFFFEKEKGHISKAIGILSQSVNAIERHIIGLFEDLQRYESNPKSDLKKQMSNIVEIFNQLIYFIREDINIIRQHTEGEKIKYIRPYVSLKDLGYCSQIIPEDKERHACIRHCIMFGYFGQIKVVWAGFKATSKGLSSRNSIKGRILNDNFRYNVEDQYRKRHFIKNILDSSNQNSDDHGMKKNISDIIRNGKEIAKLAEEFKIVIVIDYAKYPIKRYIPTGELFSSEELVFEDEGRGEISWYLQDRTCALPIVSDLFTKYNSRELIGSLTLLLGKGPKPVGPDTNRT